MNTNTELQKRVIEALAWEPGVDAVGIGVAAQDGVVTLSGEVSSLPEKWAAQQATQRVNGVRAAVDQMVIELPAGHQHGDTDIACAAANSLDWNVCIPRSRVSVLVKEGFITLDGTVDHYYQKAAAGSAVRNLMGLRGVYNNLTVEPVAMASDIKIKIEKALERAAEVDAQRITVEAHDHKVILRGKVTTWAEREEAERAAWKAPGVSDVQNHILIAA